MIVEETRHDGRKNGGGWQFLVTGILQAVEHVFQRLVDIDRCQLSTTYLLVMSQGEEELPGSPAVVARHMILTLSTSL